MLTVPELVALRFDPSALADHQRVRSALAAARLGRDVLRDEEEIDRLLGFVEQVLASAESAMDPDGRPTALMAGLTALALAAVLPNDAGRLRLRSALLFELANRPMMASAVIGDLEAPAI